MLHHAKNFFYHLKGSGDPYRTSSLLFILKCAFAHYVAQIVSGAYLARLTANLGFSDSMTGLLSAFISLSGCFQLASLFLMKKSGSMKWKIILSIQVSQILFTFIYLVPLFEMDAAQKRLLFLCGFALAYILLSAVTPNLTAWQMSLVAEDRRGRYTAVNEMFSLLTGMVFTYVMSALIDKYEAVGDIHSALVVGVVTMAVLTVVHALIFVFIKEKPTDEAILQKEQEAAFPEKKQPASDRFAFLKNRMMWKVVGVILLWYVITYVSTPFYGAYQIHELGFNMTFVSILGILYGVIRSLFSPFIGRYADRHSFSRSTYICMMITIASFLANCFTVPENGQVMYTIYYCLSALAAAGISSAQTNLIFDYVSRGQCRQALAVCAAVSGVVGFLTTCVMSPVVDLIQKNGNRIFGIPMYAGQFVSVVALLLSVVLFLYIHFVFIKKNPPRVRDLEPEN